MLPKLFYKTLLLQENSIWMHGELPLQHDVLQQQEGRCSRSKWTKGSILTNIVVTHYPQFPAVMQSLTMHR